MVLGFKRRFAPFVQEGSKTHTIRADILRRWKPGRICDCFVDPRQKTMRLLGRFPCVRVEQIKIEETHHQAAPLLVRIEGVRLTPAEADLFFYRDGFRDQSGETYQYMQQAADFWVGQLPFDGVIIHWRFEK